MNKLRKLLGDAWWLWLFPVFWAAFIGFYLLAR